MRKKLIIILILINSCSYPKLEINEEVFYNNFESKNLKNINGGSFIEFDDNILLGNYNNDGFVLNLTNLNEHQFIFVSFDLFIHGSWDGNKNGFSSNDKPDKWIMELNSNMSPYNDTSQNTFITTFSNSPCFSNYCLLQSYPENYPFNNNPKTGIHTTDLQAVCDNNLFGGKTSLYKIEKTFKNSGNAIVINFYDELYQPNAIDSQGENQQKCDESWSIDNLSIRILSYK